MKTILLTNGRIWDGTQFLEGDIYVKDGIISKIGPRIGCSADFVFDARDKIVSTGLVDAHAHFRGISPNQYGSPAEAVCFPFGVTAAADASAEQGNQAVIHASMVKTVVFVCPVIRNNQTDFSDAETLLARYGDHAVGIKLFFDTSASEVTDITVLKEVCEFAHKRNIRVLVHTTRSPVPMADITGLLCEGDILTHAFHGGVNNALEDHFQSLMHAQKRGVIIDAGLAGTSHVDFSIFREAINRGLLPNVIGTDITKLTAFIRGGRFGMTMCMNIAAALGMEETDILRAVTSGPAKALGKENKWGRLKEGDCADIAVLQKTNEAMELTDKAGYHLHSDKGYRCLLTIADGEVVYRH